MFRVFPKFDTHILEKENILALILKNDITSEIIRKCVLMDQNEVPYFFVLREQCDLYVSKLDCQR